MATINVKRQKKLNNFNDTYINSKYPDYNYGSDELLYLKKEISGSNFYNTHVLFKFDSSSLSPKLNNKELLTASLELYIAPQNELNLTKYSFDYDLKVYPISGSFECGNSNDYLNHYMVLNNMSFDNINGITYNQYTGSITLLDSVFGSLHVTGSDGKINIDITDVVKLISSGSEYTGIILKYDDVYESDNKQYSNAFYSINSKSIFQPKIYLHIQDTTTVVSSSIDDYNFDNDVVINANIKKTYSWNSIQKIYIKCGETPTKTFDSRWELSTYTDKKYSNLKYSIKDAIDGMVVIDNYTIDYDDSYNYIMIDVSNFYIGKYYSLYIHVYDTDGNLRQSELKGTFKVI